MGLHYPAVFVLAHGRPVSGLKGLSQLNRQTPALPTAPDKDLLGLDHGKPDKVHVAPTRAKSRIHRGLAGPDPSHAQSSGFVAVRQIDGEQLLLVAKGRLMICRQTYFNRGPRRDGRFSLFRRHGRGLDGKTPCHDQYLHGTARDGNRSSFTVA